MKSDKKILFVDDEPEILKSFQRRFRSTFQMEMAESGEEGLEKIRKYGPYVVVISDFRMPAMDGIEFLSKVSSISPDTIRIMLTGQPDLELAIKAVNEGRVFRFFTKPCPHEILRNGIEDALRFHELIESERELAGMKKWRKNIEKLIHSFAALIETRDPYTAGHQQRVTRLACLIGKEVGLDPDQVEGVRMAAMIHDIGKIYVPSEFLNRPGRLSKAEFAIIKTHPQVGYDVLKNIDFEYPVSSIIHQHHEAMDGSGYPLGLTKDQILPEARIIMVADVVEAMSSHRPYRPSLGLDLALQEIKINRGGRYDQEVVDACLSLANKDRTIFDQPV